MLRCCTFSCTCTHTSCHAAVRSLPSLEKWAYQSAISRMINMEMMMMMMTMMMMMIMRMMMKLFLILKFRFSAFCAPPCKMFEKWQQRGPPQMPGTLFLDGIGFQWCFPLYYHVVSTFVAGDGFSTGYVYLGSNFFTATSPKEKSRNRNQPKNDAHFPVWEPVIV